MVWSVNRTFRKEESTTSRDFKDSDVFDRLEIVTTVLFCFFEIEEMSYNNGNLNVNRTFNV